MTTWLSGLFCYLCLSPLPWAVPGGKRTAGHKMLPRRVHHLFETCTREREEFLRKQQLSLWWLVAWKKLIMCAKKTPRRSARDASRYLRELHGNNLSVFAGGQAWAETESVNKTVHVWEVLASSWLRIRQQKRKNVEGLSLTEVFRCVCCVVKVCQALPQLGWGQAKRRIGGGLYELVFACLCVCLCAFEV